MSKKIQITQFKSAIGYNKKTKATIKALGIKKLNSPVLVNNDSAPLSYTHLTMPTTPYV